MSSPTPSTDRLTLIDSLRGAALFGVLLINMLWFAGIGNSVSLDTLMALPTANLDTRIGELIDLLVSAKAIGVFSFLFGVGFAMQAEKFEGHGDARQRRFVRRLLGLLLIGVVHWLGVWSGEILHVYALAGFVLLLVFRWNSATLLTVGLILAVFARPIAGRLYLMTGGDAAVVEAGDNEELAARFAVFAHGGFLDAVALQFREDICWQLASGSAVAALLHALGRFMIGLVVARRGYLRTPTAYQRSAALLAAATLPLGFVLEHDWAIAAGLQRSGIVMSPLATQVFEHACNSLGVVCMTAGYVALFIVAWGIAPVRRAFSWLAPAGRMALTNYLSQTAINYLLFFGFGLALMGHVGVAACLGITVVIYLLQAGFSCWWLSRFNFGPFEWLWRWWTYGARPEMHKVAP